MEGFHIIHHITPPYPPFRLNPLLCCLIRPLFQHSTFLYTYFFFHYPGVGCNHGGLPQGRLFRVDWLVLSPEVNRDQS